MIIQGSTSPLRGEINVPGDKSISHRSIMFGALAQGDTRVRRFLRGADCMSTIRVFRQLGIEIEESPEEIIVHGKGLHGLTAPDGMLDVGNSGTTMRLCSGILAGQGFDCSLTGDASICKRPMGRVMTPLTQMGARISSRQSNGCAPLDISGSPLKGIHYESPVASAQVKSCVLLAGLYADGETSVNEPAVSRDHSERMLRAFGADVVSEGTRVTIQPEPTLIGQDIDVPGDISSAAYFIAAGLLIPGSEVLVKNVGTNPTRDGMLRVCQAMGGNITRLNERLVSGEPVCDLLVRGSELKGITIEGTLIPTLIDELPMIAVMAAFAQGTTIIRDAAELKVKESNRIDTVCENLRAMGADVEPTDDGMIIHGGPALHGAVINSYLDHRIAMSFAVGACTASGSSEILSAECVDISYPDFYTDLLKLRG